VKTRQYLLGKLKKALSSALKAGNVAEIIALSHEIERLADIPEKAELQELKEILRQLQEKTLLYDAALNVQQLGGVPRPGNGRLGIAR
jgi:hypothetical protein